MYKPSHMQTELYAFITLLTTTKKKKSILNKDFCVDFFACYAYVYLEFNIR